MKKFTFKSLLVIALAIIPMTFFGQEQKDPNSNWYFGIEGGASQMFSDNTSFKMDQTSWNAGINIGYMLKSSIYMYGNLGYVNLKGEGKKFKIDECNLFQGSLNLGYDILQLFSFNPDRTFALIPHVGYGFMMHKSSINFSNGTNLKIGYKESLNGSGIGSRRFVFTTPFGLNFMFKFTKHFQANIDVVATKADTEALDGVFTGKHSDWYGTANIGIAYRFGNKINKPNCPTCPEVQEATPDCDACKDAIREAVEEALKNQQPVKAAAAEEEKAEEVEAAAVVWEDKDINLTYKVGKAEVLKTQANNEEADKVKDDVKAGREISVVRTVGYASPEGNEEQNMQLSEDRAEAAADFIKERLGSKAKGIDFESEGMGSDWDGFYKALADSNISAKDEIAKQIKNSENPTATLNQLRNQYPQLNEILNSLRRTQVFVK
jgi:outer membrane protein OmpA-like peptidoglycan-associated protein